MGINLFETTERFTDLGKLNFPIFYAGAKFNTAPAALKTMLNLKMLKIDQKIIILLYNQNP